MIETIRKYGVYGSGFDDAERVNNVIDTIESQPTIEAVPVVHCKDCKYRTWFCPGYGCGNYNSPFYIGSAEDVPIMTKPDDFCSYGEKDRQKEGLK